MRHAASMVAAMEGMSRPAFRVAKELASNSRSGLTVRFLAKKLDMPEEEIEYLVEVNHRFLFTDLTKIRIAPEGISAVKRVKEGLENRGDVASLHRHVKSLGPHEFRHLEELVELEKPGAKKRAVEELLRLHYTHPDSIVTYVATRGFSAGAREVFDLVWQSKKGLMAVSKIRAVYDGTDYEVEQAIWELLRGLALFEMFRFDAEERLVRVVGLLSEARQWREEQANARAQKVKLRAVRATPDRVFCSELGLSDRICRLVAAIAAKPVRLRGDGDLFREDRRRLSEIVPEEGEDEESGEAPLSTCLWVAEGVGWLAQVDNELHAGDLEPLIGLGRIERHRILSDWMLSRDKDILTHQQLDRLGEEFKPDTWYRTVDAVRHINSLQAEDEQPVLRSVGGHWRYMSPSAASSLERRLCRALEETLYWLGVVDRAEADEESLFCLTKLGVALLTGKGLDALEEVFPERTTEIVVQPNFDIMVPAQDTDPLLTVPLDQFAVRASTGSAIVYNMTKDSFTHAMQEGHDAEKFIEFLLMHNRGGALPANVMTTLEDWRGGVRRVRLRTIHILETDDPLVLADVMHRRRLKKYFAPIDSNNVVAYRKASRAELTRELEKDGFIVE